MKKLFSIMSNLQPNIISNLTSEECTNIQEASG